MENNGNVGDNATRISVCHSRRVAIPPHWANSTPKISTEYHECVTVGQFSIFHKWRVETKTISEYGSNFGFHEYLRHLKRDKSARIAAADWILSIAFARNPKSLCRLCSWRLPSSCDMQMNFGKPSVCFTLSSCRVLCLSPITRNMRKEYLLYLCQFAWSFEARHREYWIFALNWCNTCFEFR